MYQIDNSTAIEARPAATPAGVAGWFSDGNPAQGTPATILPAEWLNMIQSELLAILVAAGVDPQKGAFNQLLTSLRSEGVFQTPPVGDRSTKAATTEFVKDTVGRRTAATAYSTSQNLTLAQAGSFLAYTGSASGAFNLPTPVNNHGVFYDFWNNSPYPLTLTTPAGALIGPSSNGGVVLPGSEVTVTSDGGNWVISGANGQASFAANGYVKLPNGFIIQWGTVSGIPAGSQTVAVTLPLTWPNGFLGGLAADVGAGCFPYAVGAGGTNATVNLFAPYAVLNGSSASTTPVARGSSAASFLVIGR